jgi:hypothetical protein
LFPESRNRAYQLIYTGCALAIFCTNILYEELPQQTSFTKLAQNMSFNFGHPGMAFGGFPGHTIVHGFGGFRGGGVVCLGGGHGGFMTVGGLPGLGGFMMVPQVQVVACKYCYERAPDFDDIVHLHTCPRSPGSNGNCNTI